MKTFVNILFGVLAGVLIASYVFIRNEGDAVPKTVAAIQPAKVPAVTTENHGMPRLRVPASTKSASLQ